MKINLSLFITFLIFSSCIPSPYSCLKIPKRTEFEIEKIEYKKHVDGHEELTVCLQGLVIKFCEIKKYLSLIKKGDKISQRSLEALIDFRNNGLKTKDQEDEELMHLFDQAIEYQKIS